MANSYFRFKKFTVDQDRCAMKVTTDGCLFGAWAGEEIRNPESRMRRDRFGIRDKDIYVLDIGTGSGLLSLMIAQKNQLRIDAIEIEKDAAEQAEENVRKSPWAECIHVINIDILQFNPGKTYDFIISNPSFYEKELEGPVPKKNVAHHSGGLQFLQLFEVIRKFLDNDGKFFLLLPFKRMDEAIQLLTQSGLFVYKKVLVRTSLHHQPTRVMIMGGKVHMGTEESMMEIKNGDDYSDEFIALLKDYYLQL